MKNHELETALLQAVRKEREAVADVLRYLREVEKRKLYLEQGHSSLFAYCREKLGYSEPEAQLRIQSMRLMRAVPEVEKKIEAGELSMSVAALVQSTCRREGLEKQETRRLVTELSGSSKREAEKKLAGLYPEAPKPEKIRPVTEELTEIRFTVTEEEKVLLEELLNRKAHTNFQRSYKELLLALAKKELEKLQGKQSEAAAPQRPGLVQGRYIPANTRRAIYQRDQGRCQFKSPDGKPCHTKHGLQFDHIQPYREGGPSTSENLQLLCGAHNRWKERSRP